MYLGSKILVELMMMPIPSLWIYYVFSKFFFLKQLILLRRRKKLFAIILALELIILFGFRFSTYLDDMMKN